MDVNYDMVVIPKDKEKKVFMCPICGLGIKNSELLFVGKRYRCCKCESLFFVLKVPKVFLPIFYFC